MFRFDLISKSMEKEPNKFLLVHLLAKRMHQLADGATPLSSVTHDSKFNTAMQEFLEGQLQFKEDDTFKFGPDEPTKVTEPKAEPKSKSKKDTTPQITPAKEDNVEEDDEEDVEDDEEDDGEDDGEE